MKKNIKSIVKSIPLLNNFARWLFQKPATILINSPSYWINKCAKNSDLNIVQIGSNDGKTGDPLIALINKNKKWNVLFVEPVPYLFEKLKSNYPPKQRFKFENAAINDGSKQTFYWVKKEANENIQNLPNWYDQLGSFDKSSLTRHLNGELEPFIVESEIRGITLEELFRKNKIDYLDILHIDTEGYDWKILSQLDLDKYNPLIILFEHKHLQISEKADSIKFLKNLYFIFEFGGDFLCVRREKNNLKKHELNLLAERFSLNKT